ncbi:MAG: flagellar assembly protein FliW [Candidatus Latescibacterota bacterium]
MATDSEKRVVIKTPHGEVEVNTKNIVHFPDGLIGFEEYTDFAIFDLKDCPPFKSLLSIKEGGPDFVVLEPLEFFEDYASCVADIPYEGPELGSPYDLALLSIVTLAERPEEITVNLRGPIFLNRITRFARQVVIPDDRFQTKEPLLQRC